MKRPPRSVTFQIDYDRPMYGSDKETIIGHGWDCTLLYRGHTLTTCQMMYGALPGARPTATQVFDSLVRQARDYESSEQDVDDLTDTSVDTAFALQDLLGDSLYDRVIEEWES